MGISSCRLCSRTLIQENETQYTIPDYGEIRTITNETDSIKKISYSTTIKKSDFLKIKIQFEEQLKDKGEFILNKTITELLDEINPEANKIEVPNCKDENLPQELYFTPPPIRFNSGDIYYGSFNQKNQREGFGISISTDNYIYKGLWEKDEIGKFGLFLDNIGNYYLGELKNGKYNGKGELVIKNKLKFSGEFLDDIPNGEGKLENFVDNTVYTGYVLNNLKEKKGILNYEDGTKYEGEFKNDKFDGQGILTFPDGRKYEGQFKNNKIDGKGKFTWSDGKIYEGEYEDFMRNGNGKYFWDDNKYYEGQWTNNRQHGKGKLFCNGNEVNGVFRYGKIIMETEENS